MLITYKFDRKKHGPIQEWTPGIIKWLIENVGRCRNSMVSGKERYADVFVPTLMAEFGLTLDGIVVDGCLRAMLLLGDGWSLARLVDDDWICTFYFNIEDERDVLSFKLAWM